MVTSCEKTAKPCGVTALGGSDGYVLVQHSDGDLYVVRLENNSAYKVAGFPGSRD